MDDPIMRIFHMNLCLVYSFFNLTNLFCEKSCLYRAAFSVIFIAISFQKLYLWLYKQLLENWMYGSGCCD